MKKKDFKELLGLSVAELSKKAQELEKKIEELAFDKNMKKLKDVKSVTKTKQDRARILTVKKQKELLDKLEAIKASEKEVKGSKK